MSDNPTNTFSEELEKILSEVWTSVDIEDVTEGLIDIGVIYDAKSAILKRHKEELVDAEKRGKVSLLNQIIVNSKGAEEITIHKFQVERQIEQLQASNNTEDV